MPSISSHENSFCTFPIRRVSLDAPGVVASIDTAKLTTNIQNSEVEQEVDRNRLRSHTEIFLKDSCSDRERWVVNRVIFEGLSQYQVATELGVSRPMITKIMRRVLARGRAHFAAFSN